MDVCSVGVLAGVIVGYALGAGTKPRLITKALGNQNVDRMLSLLELLEEPRDGSERTRHGEGDE